MCWLAQDNLREARKWIQRAVGLAHEDKQPTLESSWLVELGHLALRQGRLEEADRHAVAALRIARPREHNLTIFRGEWLRYLVTRRIDPTEVDRERLLALNELHHQLDEHEGIEEIHEFRELLGKLGPAR